MKPADEITDSILDECLITYIGIEFCPLIDCDETGEPYISGTTAYNFIHRYNDKKIAIQNRFNSYISNDDIQSCLNDLELDAISFWYVLLFVYDYCVGKCIDNFTLEETAGSKIQKFVSMLESTLLDEAEITLRVGKKKVVITDRNAIEMIARNELNNTAIFSGKIKIGESAIYCDSAMAYLFCKVLRYYLGGLNHLKEKRAKGAKISNKEKELLSYLLYFTGISRNKKLLSPLSDEYNTLKGFMNPKKIPEFEGFSNWY